MGKNKRGRIDVVYSTSDDFDYEYDGNEEQETLPAEKQELRISVDRKQRKGKEATIIAGFVGSLDDLKELSKWLKSKCGVGGSVKDGEAIIQGNQRDKVMALLKDEGYRVKRVGG